VLHSNDATGKNKQLVHGEHHAAKVIEVTEAGKVIVKWAIGGSTFSPGPERFPDRFTITEREKDIIFDGLTKADGPHNGRRATRTCVVNFLEEPGNLNLQGFRKYLDSNTTRERDSSGERSFGGLLEANNITAQDKILIQNKEGLRWLVSSESETFSPSLITTGKAVLLPDCLPKEVIHGKRDPGGPSFTTCVGTVLSLMSHFEEDKQDPVYQKLQTLIYCLPALLLRITRASKAQDKKKTIKRNCTLFLEGKWKTLFNKAAEACSIHSRPGYAPPDGPADIPHINEVGVHEPRLKDLVPRAELQAKGGSFSSARQILCGAGISKEKDLLTQMQSKFPHAEPPKFPPVDPEIIYTDDEAGERLADEVERAIGRQGMTRLARQYPLVAATDQWHWNNRALTYPCLLDEHIGEAFHTLILRDRLDGYLPSLYAAYYRGGRLIPLSKAPKPGARPIVIGDAFRRLIHKAMDQVTKKAMTNFFESQYSNAIQMANGTKGGAEIKFNLIQMLLRGDMAPNPPDDPENQALEDDPTVVVSIDITNAFNEIDRQALVDIISGYYDDRTYDQGRISGQVHPELPNTYAGHYPSFRAHYGGEARLAMVNPADGSTDVVWCTKGVQQGDVIAGTLFNAAIYTIVGSVMNNHDAFNVGYADNLDTVGRCSDALRATKDLIKSLEAIGLRVNINESAMYAPSHHAATAPPKAYLDAMEDPAMPKIPWVGTGNGLKVVGFPLGPEAFVRDTLAKVRDDIRRELACMEHLEDGLIHHHMLRMCQSAMFHHLMRGLPSDYTSEFALAIDDLLWESYKAFNLKDFIVPSDPTVAQIEMERDARTQFFSLIAQGGCGIAPNSAVIFPAYFSSVAISFRLASRIGAAYPDLDEAIQSPEFKQSPFMKAFEAARKFLLECPAGMTPEQAQELRLAEADAAAAATAQGQKPPTPKKIVIIPGDDHLYRRVDDGLGSRLTPIPDQKQLTSLARTHSTDLYKADSVSQCSRARMANLSPTAVKVKAPHPEESAFQPYHVAPERVTRYSPMATFGSTAALSFVPFKRHFWAFFVTLVLGLEYPVFPNDRCQCGERDPTAPTHHDLSCKRWAAFTAGHEIIVHALERLCISGGIPVQTGSKVPKKSPNLDQRADVHTKLVTDKPSEVIDVSIVHATRGNDEPVVEAEARLSRLQPATIKAALKTKHNAKNAKYAAAYRAADHTFVPYVIASRGPIHPEAQRLLYFIAAATTLQHMHYYTTDLKYETIMARNIQRVNAVASAAIGLGIAVRARGLARGRIGQDPPRHGWRMQDDIVAERAAQDGPVDYAHLMSDAAFGAPN
jgi:hypothetical protein